jgi:hypothetical protein
LVEYRVVIDGIRRWLAHGLALGWPLLVSLSLGLVVASFVLGLVVAIKLPENYFVRVPEGAGDGRARGVAWVLVRVAKNLLGVLIFMVGFVMALPLVPGPGIVFMVVGLSLVDFPGKRALQWRLLRQRHVFGSVNRMRARFGKPPLQTVASQSVVDSGA